MRLSFNILWFDDQQQSIDVAKGVLAPRLQDVGFVLKTIDITDFTSTENLEKLIKNAARDGDIDLILLDYDLGVGTIKGNELAVTIRSRFKHKDIIFYSGHGEGIPELRKAIAAQEIDGAYCATRDASFADQIYGVIENFIKKVVDVEHMRGIVMAETSDIDAAISDCLTLAFKRISTERQQSVCKKIEKILRDSKKGTDKKVEGIKDCTDLQKFMDLPGYVFSSVHRQRSLRNAMKKLGWHEKGAEHASKYELLAKYPTDVAAKRDILAHAGVSWEGNKKILIGQSGEKIGEGDFPGIRGAILEHRKNLDEAKRILSEMTQVEE